MSKRKYVLTTTRHKTQRNRDKLYETSKEKKKGPDIRRREELETREKRAENEKMKGEKKQEEGGGSNNGLQMNEEEVEMAEESGWSTASKGDEDLEVEYLDEVEEQEQESEQVPV